MPGRKKTKGHPEVWAFLTVITFPVVLITADILGFDGVQPFLLAISATLLVLILEVLVRGRIWIFEEGFVDHIGHPQTPIRLVIFLGASLLILESALILTVATDRRMDLALLSLVVRKQCAAKYDPLAKAMCEFLGKPWTYTDKNTVKPFNPLSYTVRNEAAKRWFPNEQLVTCAERKIAQKVENELRCKHVSLIYCAAWKLDPQGTLRIKHSFNQFVGLDLQKDKSGLYTTLNWSDEPAGDSWTKVLGDLGQNTREQIQSKGYLPDPNLITLLEAEALGRAQELLRK